MSALKSIVSVSALPSLTSVPPSVTLPVTFKFPCILVLLVSAMSPALASIFNVPTIDSIVDPENLIKSDSTFSPLSCTDCPPVDTVNFSTPLKSKLVESITVSPVS